MSEIRTLGVQSIEVGTIANDGDVASSFTSLGKIYKDTASLQQSEAESIEHYCEENDDPEEVVSLKGATTIKWSIIDTTPATLAAVLGGSVSNNDWEAPDAGVNIEKSIKILPLRGNQIVVPRAKIDAAINYELSKKGIFRVDITAKVMKPTKANVKSMKIGPVPVPAP